MQKNKKTKKEIFHLKDVSYNPKETDSMLLNVSDNLFFTLHSCNIHIAFHPKACGLCLKKKYLPLHVTSRLSEVKCS